MSRTAAHRDADIAHLDLREAHSVQGGEWVTVVDKKKEKREADAKAKRDEAKRLKSAAKQQANAELSADEQAEKAAKEAAKLAEAKAKRDKANVKPQISNEKQLLDALMQVVASDPSKVMQLSTIGDRMQELTGQPWNKKFKPTYGSIKDFISQHKDRLTIDEKDKVHLTASRPNSIGNAKAAPSTAAAPKAAAPAPAAKPVAAAAPKPAEQPKKEQPKKAEQPKKETASKSQSQKQSPKAADNTMSMALVALGVIAAVMLMFGMKQGQ